MFQTTNQQVINGYVYGVVDFINGAISLTYNWYVGP